MSPKVITSTCQEYMGRRYYRCGKYFQRDGDRLHRKVWEDKNGAVPKGFHVHHVDHDRANNSIENLSLIGKAEHAHHHHAGHSRPLSKAAYDAAAKWHKSKAGENWHRKHYEQNRHKLNQTAAFKCGQCGEPFVAGVTGRNRFCSNACKSQYRRLSGADDVSRDCTECRKPFVVNKYDDKKSCSRTCAARITVRKRGHTLR